MSQLNHEENDDHSKNSKNFNSIESQVVSPRSGKATALTIQKSSQSDMKIAPTQIKNSDE